MAEIYSTTNGAVSFSIGVEINRTGRVTSFAHGEINVCNAERVAGELVMLAHAIRDEARRTVILE